MATPLSYPQINGCRHSWASIELKLGAQIYYCTAINYSRKRDRTMVAVNHPDPVGKTRGKNTYSCDVELLLAEFGLFKAALTAIAGGPGYGDVPFTIIVTYGESQLDTVTDTILGCTMDSTEASNSEGTDPTKRKFDCAPLKILFDGVDDLASPLVAPPGG